MKHLRFNKSVLVILILLMLAFNTIGATPAFAAGTLMVTKTADTDDGVCDADCSLREAIAVALAGDTIIFDSGLSGGVIHLASPLTLDKNLIIDGSALASQITISGDTDNDGTGNVRVFIISSSSVTATIKSLNITMGIATGYYGGGGIFNQGGGTLTIRNVTFSQNSASGHGGGLYGGGIVTVIDSTFLNNSSGWTGGGIWSGGVLNVKNSTFSNNSASSYQGGAISGNSSVTNSTFSGNYATQGGAIYGSSLTITNSTFSGNIATSSGYGGGVYNTSGTIKFANNIIANSTGGDCRYSGTFITNTDNLVEDGSCLASLSGDPRLSILANNGGPTQTMALVSGSPAVDAGDDAICAASPVSNLDQRGVTRPDGTHCDIGAYEGSIPASNITFKSAGAQDGWILESSETSNTGGSLDNSATTLRVGDDAAKRQYRSILSFKTSTLPDNAIITKITLKLKNSSVSPAGTNPIALLQGISVDIRKGFFSTSPNLQLTDFNATASKTVGPFSPALSGGWYTINLNSATFNFINKLTTNGGLTQMRLRFKLDDNNNAIANILNVASGNHATLANRPQLIVEYYVP